jgi:sugar/nucleoside kinase (ribokinase family)
MGFKISIVGPLNVDLVIKGTAPPKIEDLKTWVGPSDIYFLVAGAAGYISQNLKKLGNTIHLTSCVGDDPFGKMILNYLNTSGIDTSYIQVEKGTLGAIAIFMLLFGDNKRPLTYRLPTHHGWPPKFNDSTTSYLLDADLIHIAGYLHFPDLWTDEIPTLLMKCKKQRIRTSLDPQFPLTYLDPPWLSTLKPLLKHLDILLIDEFEALNITGTKSIQDAGRLLLNEGLTMVAIKLGPKGVFIKDENQELVVSTIKPKHFIDTIGAGDSFDAGFLHAVLRGYTLKDAAKSGLYTASKSIEGIGGSQTFPSSLDPDLI